MSLRVCFYGRGDTGSYIVRALQIAEMRSGWTATSRLLAEHYMDCDVVCFVKLLERRKVELLRQLGKRVVLDLLDCWNQPDDGLRLSDLEAAQAFFSARLRALKFDAVIYPNRAMRDDLAHLLPPGEVIYHHYHPDLEERVVPVREQARTVGYQGRANYLGEWRGEIEAATALYSRALQEARPPRPGSRAGDRAHQRSASPPGARA